MPADKIDTFLELCTSTQAVTFSGDNYVLPDTFTGTVTASGIPYEPFDKLLRLKLRQYFEGCEVQYSETISDSLEPYSGNKNVILTSTTGCYWYEPHSHSFSNKGTVDAELQRKFRNAVAYFSFFDFLQNEDVCDYFNDANSEIVFYNSANGIIKVTFDARPIVDFPGEITNDLKKLQQVASPSEITSVFVNAIYQLSQGTGQVTLRKLVNERQNVIDITKRDYELISKKFDFAKFRNSLYAEKEKYFKDIREVVNKIFSQAIGIPISIGASVFTTYKVQGDNFVIALVLAGFIIYLVFYIRLQWIYKNDLKDVKDQFGADFSIIAQDSGLPTNTISKEKDKVMKKISSVQSIQNWLIGIVMLLGVLVTVFMVTQFGNKKEETPDLTIKELTEAIKRFTLMTKPKENGFQQPDTSLPNSPEQFSINVEFNKKNYEVNVVRVSANGHPNEYWTTIPTAHEILNKFPPVKYVVNKENLLFTDSLANILPGFADKQKSVLLEEFKKRKWKL
ncbi:MAG TPA: hypothetical protein VF487_04305 [Chitinophagaceae bacterium]